MSDTIPLAPARPGIYAGVSAGQFSADGQTFTPIPFSTAGVYTAGYVILVVKAVGLKFTQVRLRLGTMAVSWSEPGDGTTWLTLGPTDGRVRQPLGVRLADADGTHGPELFIQYDPK